MATQMGFCLFTFISHNRISHKSLNDILDLGFKIGSKDNSRTFECTKPSRAAIIKLFDIIGFNDNECDENLELTSLSDVMPSLENFAYDFGREDHDRLSVQSDEDYSVIQEHSDDFTVLYNLNEISTKEQQFVTGNNKDNEVNHDNKGAYKMEKEVQVQARRTAEVNNERDEVKVVEKEKADGRGANEEDEKDEEYDEREEDEDDEEAVVSKFIFPRTTYDLFCKHFKNSRTFECLRTAHESYGGLMVCVSDSEMLKDIIEFRKKVRVKKIYGELNILSEIADSLNKQFGESIVIEFHNASKFIILTAPEDVLSRIKELNPNYFF